MWFLRKDKYRQRFSLFEIKYVCNAYNSYVILLIFIRLGLIRSANIKTDYLVTLVGCTSILFVIIYFNLKISPHSQWKFNQIHLIKFNTQYLKNNLSLKSIYTSIICWQ